MWKVLIMATPGAQIRAIMRRSFCDKIKWNGLTRWSILVDCLRGRG